MANKICVSGVDARKYPGLKGKAGFFIDADVYEKLKAKWEVVENNKDETSDDISKLTVAKLKEIAKEKGIDISKAKNKAEIIEIIENYVEDDASDDEKSEYKVLKGIEFPRGIVHEVDAVIELTDDEASEFADGLIEKIEQ